MFWICLRGLTAGIVCCLLAFLKCPAALADGPLPRSVLVINQFELASPATTALLSSLRSTLKGAASPTSVYIENLDLGRFGGARFKDTVRSYLHEKYRDTPIGVIVAVGSAALEQVLHLRTALWVDVPIVFGAVDEMYPEELTLFAKVTGTTTPAPLSDFVSVARTIVPGLKRIAVVGDPPERQFVRRMVPAELQSLAGQFELIDLTRLRMSELKQRVASLPADSAIIYIGLTLDADNVAYTSQEALAALAQVANRPIIVQAETLLGTGAVGGIVASSSTIGREAAELTLRVLAGDDPATIPVTTGNAMKPIFDWRQLQRWNVSEDRLPPGSEVRFRAPTMWEQYRWYIVLAAAICVVQAIFILVLLVNWLRLRRANAERRRAEQAAHELSGRLIKAQEDDRSRLARELHDDVTQRLAIMAIDAGREERRLSDPDRNTAMRGIREGLVRLSEDVHALSYRLHPAILEDLGLVEALKAECERLSPTCSIRLDVDTQQVPAKLPQDVALCLFRIAQEGLRNVARHAGASRADVCLRRLDGGLQLTVKDDGVGFDAGQRRTRMSLGHAGMAQRAGYLGGRVHIDSSPGRGTEITAWVPLKEERSEPSTCLAG